MIVEINSKKYLDVSVDEFLSEARSYLGKPYVYGGDGTPKECMSNSCTVHTKGKKYVGYDCSGYVSKVLSKWDYNKFGRSTSQMQSQSSYGTWISNKSELLPGDLIFFKGHVGIVSKVVGPEVYMYHSSKCGKNISETSTTYRSDFTKGLRILTSNLNNKNSRGDSMNYLAILDAGHAEYVAGKESVDKSLREWKFNNDMQYLLKPRLEEHGISVYLTNPNPEKKDEMGLSKRAQLASDYWKSKGKPKALFVSIHGNAFSDTKARGTETFIAGNASSNSKNAAKFMQQSIVSTMKSLDSKALDRGIKTHNYTVIQKCQCPAILIEYAFYTNNDDLKILKNNKKELVEATVKAFCQYFGITYKAPNKATSQPKPESNGSSEFKIGTYGKKVKVTANALKVRSGRGTEHSEIGKLSKGDVVTINYILPDNRDGVGNDDLWGSFSYNGKDGFIHLGYVVPC